MVFGAYALPFRANRWVRGWQVSTTSPLYTGQPFTPRVANANLNLARPTGPTASPRARCRTQAYRIGST